jgi:hypothetical protein
MEKYEEICAHNSLGVNDINILHLYHPWKFSHNRMENSIFLVLKLYYGAKKLTNKT